MLAVAKAYADYFQIGRGSRRYLAYGNWDLDSQPDSMKRARMQPSGVLDGQSLSLEPLQPSRITEDVSKSWYKSRTHLPPSHGETEADPKKPGAYTFIKAPRYNSDVYEVGPLARMLISYVAGDENIQKLVDGALAELKVDIPALFSVMGRHAARALECKVVADAMADWVVQLKPGEPNCARYELPETSNGMGLTEGPRGALGHWIKIEGGVIANFQAVVPTTWNCSPRDDNGQPGTCEQALEGTNVKDAENPFELARIVRSFDPCLACSIHTVTPKGRAIGKFRVS